MCFWRTLADGRITSDSLPAALDISHMHKGITGLWKKTCHSKKENGGCIVLTADERLTLCHATGGDYLAWYPRHRRCTCDFHLGFFHTHYLLDGKELPWFSDADFAAVLEAGSLLAIVRSGESVSALLRADVAAHPYPPDERERAEYLSVFERYYARDDIPSVIEVQRLANLELCDRLGFTLYAGDCRGFLSRELKERP